MEFNGLPIAVSVPLLTQTPSIRWCEPTDYCFLAQVFTRPQNRG